ncbi:MAG: FtsX-like permease family protein [Candidatus Methylomirabilia bacterium]
MSVRLVSGAFLAADAAPLPPLTGRLKRTPAVAGVSVRESMLASFYETIAQSMTATNSVLILFACIIAFGIVYNGARISLFERGHELASLRVLGFTRREIAVILLGEHALLTLAAVPLGFGIGAGSGRCSRVSWWSDASASSTWWRSSRRGSR